MERGPHKQWRLLAYLTKSIEFREAVLSAWTSYAADNTKHTKDTPLLFWQASKLVLRGNILSYTVHRDKKLHKSFSELQTNLTSAYIKFKDSLTSATKEAYQSHRVVCDALLAQMELKYTFLARSKIHRFGNRSGKLLSSLLKGQHSPTIIKCLRGAVGVPTVKGGEIVAILHSFYTKLYSQT